LTISLTGTVANGEVFCPAQNAAILAQEIRRIVRMVLMGDDAIAPEGGAIK